MRHAPTAFLMIGCAVLAGCGGKAHTPAPIYDLKLGGKSAGTAIVSSGDTLDAIASRYALTLDDIIRANMISDIRPGQRLRLPPPRSYRVRAGDSLNRIAGMFDLQPQAIARENNLSAPYTLQIGQTLRLPGPREAEPPHQTAAPSHAPSSHHDASVTREYIAPNTIDAQPVIPGQPRPPALSGHTMSGHTMSGHGGIEAVPLPADPAYTPEALSAPAPQAAALSMPPQPAPLASADAAASAVQLPVDGSGMFASPVQGRVISDYGPKPGGLFNEGINIAASPGTPVRAADAGTVVYAGDGLDGYGNLVLLRHDNGYFTVYGHMADTRVAKGVSVARGQRIGSVGASGKVAEPQLHFEIRQGTKSLNPLDYM